MNKAAALVLAAALLLVPACRENPSGLVWGTGTVAAGLAECSSWFVTADSGRIYELTNLPAEFRQKGLRVRFALRKCLDCVSVCMRGEIADVISIEKL